MKGHLYRFFNVHGGLLYVGSTIDIKQRTNQHKRKPWWPEVANIKVETFDAWQDACAAEADLLRSGRCGVYNVHPSEQSRRGRETIERRKQEAHAQGLKCKYRGCRCQWDAEFKQVAS